MQDGVVEVVEAKDELSFSEECRLSIEIQYDSKCVGYIPGKISGGMNI